MKTQNTYESFPDQTRYMRTQASTEFVPAAEQYQSPTQKSKSPVTKSRSPAKSSSLSSSLPIRPGMANMFRNEAYEAKIAAIQDEFQRLLKKDNGRSSPAKGSPTKKSSAAASSEYAKDLNMDDFYKVMGEFYDNKMKRHASPTKRLMDQKKAAFEHKTYLYKKLQSGEIDERQYSLTYVASPQKTYMIQPKEGEINYDLAQKNPLKFYDKIMKQDVVEHKVQKQSSNVQNSQSGELPMKKSKSHLGMKTKTTKRAVAMILSAVQIKIQQLMMDKLAEYNMSDIEFAFAHPEAKQVIQKEIAQNNIRMVGKNNEPVFQR